MASNMGLCSVCSNLELDFTPSPRADAPPKCPNTYWKGKQVHLLTYELPRVDALIQSANRSCESCQFFYNLLEAHGIKSRDLKQRLYLEKLPWHPLAWTIASDLHPAIKNVSGLKSYFKHRWFRGGKALIDTVADPVESSEWLEDDRKRATSLSGQLLELEVCIEPEAYIESAGHRTLDPTRICATRTPKDPASKATFDIAHLWLNRCLSTHTCSQLEASPLPKRVIHVPTNLDEPLRLACPELGTTGQYIALSHCWGGSIATRLLESTLESFQTEISFDYLPRNFRDAVTVTRALGISYLWIDALCIIQDSRDDWFEQAPLMGSTYHNAILTISALTSNSSNEGFLHPRRLCSPALGKDMNRYLRSKPTDLSADMRTGILNTRGWCAQERLMSPRILYFASEQIHWECSAARYSEGMPDCLIDGGQITGMTKNLVQKVLEVHQAPLPPYERLAAWSFCVLEYAGRKLTYDSDKLPAIAALASELNMNGELGTYCAGLWSSNIFVSLAWNRIQPAKHDEHEEKRPQLVRSATYRAPSWSWAAYDGLIKISSDLHEQAKDEQDLALWKTWEQRFAPRLVNAEMKLKDESQPYMEILPGSHLLVDAWYREIIVRGAGAVELKNGKEGERFESPSFSPTIASDWHKDFSQVKDKVYICVPLNIQIRRSRRWSDILIRMLVLESDSDNKVKWRRIGVYLYADDIELSGMCSVGWQKAELKLV